jgi:hypothetical protein
MSSEAAFLIAFKELCREFKRGLIDIEIPTYSCGEIHANREKFRPLIDEEELIIRKYGLGPC